MSRASERGRKPRYADKLVFLDVACNDPDNGLFAGRASILQVCRREDSIDLECSGGRPPRFTELSDGRLRLFHLIVPYTASKEWFGNWCWNRYTVTVPDAAAVLCAAIANRLFTVDGASGEPAITLSQALDAGAPPSLVEALLANFGAR